MNNRIIYLLLLFPNLLFSINMYFKGDTLYSWASEGLILHSSDTISSKRIGVVKTNDYVIALEDKTIYLENTLEVSLKREYSIVNLNKTKVNFPSINLNGKMVKVNYNGIIGYVFDGYLSQVKLPQDNYTFEDCIKNFLETEFSPVIKIQNAGANHSKINYFFDKGISYTIISWGEGGTRQILLPNISYEEIIILLSKNLLSDYYYLANIESKQDLKSRLRNIKISSAEGNYLLDLQENESFCIITIHSSC